MLGGSMSLASALETPFHLFFHLDCGMQGDLYVPTSNKLKTAASQCGAPNMDGTEQQCYTGTAPLTGDTADVA